MDAFRLVKLDNRQLTYSDPDEDLRGRWVVTRTGEEFGYIDALLLDDQAYQVRFLQVMTENVLGPNKGRVLLPVDAVVRVDTDDVVVDQTSGHIAGSPLYDPDQDYDRDYYDGVYAYYGYPPYWSRQHSAP